SVLEPHEAVAVGGLALPGKEAAVERHRYVALGARGGRGLRLLLLDVKHEHVVAPVATWRHERDHAAVAADGHGLDGLPSLVDHLVAAPTRVGLLVELGEPDTVVATNMLDVHEVTADTEVLRTLAVPQRFDVGGSERAGAADRVREQPGDVQGVLVGSQRQVGDFGYRFGALQIE